MDVIISKHIYTKLNAINQPAKLKATKEYDHAKLVN